MFFLLVKDLAVQPIFSRNYKIFISESYVTNKK